MEDKAEIDLDYYETCSGWVDSSNTACGSSKSFSGFLFL